MEDSIGAFACGDCACEEEGYCGQCCDDAPTEASIDIPADWGAVTGGIMVGPANACYGASEDACPPPGPPPPIHTCNPCNDITARTLVFDLTVLNGDCAHTGDCKPSMDEGSPCGIHSVAFTDSFDCCDFPPAGPGFTTAPGVVTVCANIRFGKHVDDDGCRVFISINVTTRMTCDGVSTLVQSYGRSYASDVIAGKVCKGTIEVFDNMTRGGSPITGECGALPCTAMPTSFMVTVA
jgi:hypothetical protein